MMDRNSLMWILECCILSLDGQTKEDMIGYGSPEALAEAGIKLCAYLKEKEINVYETP